MRPIPSAEPERDDGDPLIDTTDLDELAEELPGTVLGEALRRAARERARPPASGARYQRAME